MMAAVDKNGLMIGGVALVLIGISVAGLETKVFPNRVNAAALQRQYVNQKTAGLLEGLQLQKKQIASWNSAYVLPKRTLLAVDEGGAQKASVAEDSQEFVSMRLSGILTGVDGTPQAVINRSLVTVGSMVSGCEVVEITPTFVGLKVGKDFERLQLNEERRFRRTAFQKIKLDGVVKEGGVWRAKINGHVYRAGDWVDSETQVRAVTPQMVMVFRAGSSMKLEVAP